MVETRPESPARADSRATTERRGDRPRVARGTSQNDAMDDAVETHQHDALDTQPFQRADLETRLEAALREPASGPESQTMVVDPPKTAAAPQAPRSAPSQKTHVVQPAWDPEHTSHTATQLANFKPSQSMWLGVAVAPPEVGASILIGTYLSREFTITSPVTKIIARDDGVLVQTTSQNRYFVGNTGDAYLVRKIG